MIRNRPCHHTSLFPFPLKFAEIHVLHALLFRVHPALTAFCKLLEVWFSKEHTSFFLDQTDGSFCKFVFVVHTERLSVHAALSYPCHVGDWVSLPADRAFVFKLLTPGVNWLCGGTTHISHLLMNCWYHRLVNAQWLFLYRNHLYKICTPAEFQVGR